jgi:hypothetical protein
MRQITLQTLTWGTVTAAVSSALWLASVEADRPDLHKGRASGTAGLQIPKEPTGAGVPLRPPPSSSRGARP